MIIAHLVLGFSSVYHTLNATGEVPVGSRVKGKVKHHGFKTGGQEGISDRIELRHRRGDREATGRGGRYDRGTRSR
ncbi:hypothetical protein KDH_72810 [Dictyobacter sp. S3.2.2.5]|uniref:Alcohol dehydrogenase N-terminal domain-containing protein n=1 Tax=Dictyobacter halimunensis TaxID=3026934 RepID=A0ABQ6G5A8_9CHLR|nr:hypothetical protein KDH_72810 [Dictyobacter sp. S3.2.2.5]